MDNTEQSEKQIKQRIRKDREAKLDIELEKTYKIKKTVKIQAATGQEKTEMTNNALKGENGRKAEEVE